MQNDLMIFAAIAAVTSGFSVIVGIFWLVKLRNTVAKALAENAQQQLRTALKLGDAIGQVQKRQEQYNEQLIMLAEAGLRMRQEISNMSNRLEGQPEANRGSQTLH